jgi:hypothetical protein
LRLAEISGLAESFRSPCLCIDHGTDASDSSDAIDSVSCGQRRRPALVWGITSAQSGGAPVDARTASAGSASRRWRRTVDGSGTTASTNINVRSATRIPPERHAAPARRLAALTFNQHLDRHEFLPGCIFLSLSPSGHCFT